MDTGLIKIIQIITNFGDKVKNPFILLAGN